jgi:Mut7-C RNAse domain
VGDGLKSQCIGSNIDKPLPARPLLPLAVVLPRVLENIEAELAKERLNLAKEVPLRRRAELIRSLLAPEPAPPYLATEVPERSRAAGGPLRMCPECGRLYWSGGHVRRMQQRLAAWQQEATPPS